MTCSLRFVFAGITAFIVLVVAASTLAITLTVSLDAVRNTGRSLSLAIENTVQTQVENWLGVAENHGLDFAEMIKRPEFLFPSNDSNAQWWDKWLIPMRVDFIASNYTYTSVSVVYADGSLSTVVPLGTDAYGLAVVDSRTLWTTGSGTYNAWAYNRTTQQAWDTTVMGPLPSLAANRGDQRVPGFWAVVSLTGKRPGCLWFPPSLYSTGAVGDGYFALYAACILLNATGVFMGTFNVGRPLDGVAQFLQGTTKTPNTQIMVVDGYSLLVASTYSAPYYFQYDPKDKSAGGNCASSLDISPIGSPPVIGCRSYAAEYPYPPLQAVAADADFLVTKGLVQRYGSIGDETYYYISSRIASRLTAYSMNLVLFMPETDVLGDIITGRNIAIIVTSIVFLFAAGLSVLLTGLLLKPLDDVAGRMYRTAQLDDDESFSGITDLDGADSARDGEQPATIGKKKSAALRTEDRERLDSNFTEIKALQVAYSTMDTAIKSFTRYVPRDVVKELMSTNQMCEIAMRPIRCSMLFTDIANFTSICERVPPHVLSRLVRLFFERSSALIMWHGGVIDKFIGDCIMAVFGAPVPVDLGEVRAAVCGRMLVHDTSNDPLKNEFALAGEKLSIRVGVASGEVLAGNMGSEMRMSYTVIGDNVNLASRLEGLNKSWGTQIMVCEATAEECSAYLAMRYVVQVAVVGKQAPVRVYEVLGVHPDADTDKATDGGAAGAEHSTSDNLTIQQIQQGKARRELDDAYGTANAGSATAGHTAANVGRLLRRCRRKCPVTPNEIEFAQVYSAAMEAFIRRDFATSIELLRRGDNVGEGDYAGVVSVQRLLAASTKYVTHPPGPDFNGVFVASEK